MRLTLLNTPFPIEIDPSTDTAIESNSSSILITLNFSRSISPEEEVSLNTALSEWHVPEGYIYDFDFDRSVEWSFDNRQVQLYLVFDFASRDAQWVLDAFFRRLSNCGFPVWEARVESAFE